MEQIIFDCSHILRAAIFFCKTYLAHSIFLKNSLFISPLFHPLNYYICFCYRKNGNHPFFEVILCVTFGFKIGLISHYMVFMNYDKNSLALSFKWLVAGKRHQNFYMKIYPHHPFYHILSLREESPNTGKYGSEKTPYLDIFRAVSIILHSDKVLISVLSDRLFFRIPSNRFFS